MTITSVRIYYHPDDAELKLPLSRSHWGFATWFERRLKPIKNRLRDEEAKGVNIVNFMLFGDVSKACGLDQWAKRLNSFEFSCLRLAIAGLPAAH
jgi:hypothetical protein